MPVRFGPASGVESVRLTPTDEDPAGLRPMLISVEMRAAAVEEVTQLYKEQLLPLHFVGWRLGYNAYKAMMFLMNRTDIGVKCCAGTPDERHNGFALSRQPGSLLSI
jgi:hypothetical protein